MAKQEQRDPIAVGSGEPPRKRRGLGLGGQMLFGLLVGTAMATGSAADIKRVLADPKSFSASVESGRRLASFCFNCHGEDGHSRIPETPNIAGQNAVYLHEQIRKFANGERRNDFMQGLTRALSEDERINVAIYFAAQKAYPASANAGPVAAAGANLFRRTCANCHGEAGHGKDEIPRVAGQHGIYLTRALSAYRAKDGTRGDPRMSAVAAALSDQEIASLAAYLSALP
ncbi:MAG TPA: c-type cytochrome [Rhodocyclaceae bacterium]